MKIVKLFFRVINIGLIIYLIFFEKKETESTWAWILLLLNFPVTGFVLFLLTGQSIPKQKGNGKKEYIGTVTEDNHVEILTLGEEKFKSVFTDIKSARKEILIQYYIFKEDFLFEYLQELLYKKVSEGRHCRKSLRAV